MTAEANINEGVRPVINSADYPVAWVNTHYHRGGPTAFCTDDDIVPVSIDTGRHAGAKPTSQLPTFPAWMREAACVNESADFAAKQQPTKYMRSVCSACAVVGDCRQFGIDTTPACGVWVTHKHLVEYLDSLEQVAS